MSLKSLDGHLVNFLFEHRSPFVYTLYSVIPTYKYSVIGTMRSNSLGFFVDF